jgi:XTP/dITP diphosphohydrolase
MITRPRLIIASNNPGKVREFKDLLGERVEILSMADLGLSSPPETAADFAGNAELKARYVFTRTGIVTIADDSGLEVAALGGQPGVLSARYAGEHGDDAANRNLVLKQLADVPSSDRDARFVAAIVAIDRQGTSTLVQGHCEGRIAHEERGDGGFGYDSIFELAPGRTMAEISSAEKAQVSHRGKAVREILPVLERALGIDRGK